MKVDIILADDHAIIRDGMKSMLENTNGFKIIAEVETGKAAVEMTLALNPDLIIMDITMPELNGIEAAKKIRAAGSNVKILALTMHEEPIYIRQVISAGANGYLPKDCKKELLLEAIECVLKGELFLQEALMRKMITSGDKSANDIYKILSEREVEVLRLIAEELTNAEIADKLNLSVRTVDTHRRNILEKLDVRNTAGLVKIAIKFNLI